MVTPGYQTTHGDGHLSTTADGTTTTTTDGLGYPDMSGHLPGLAGEVGVDITVGHLWDPA